MSDVRGVRDALAVLNEYVKGAVDWRDVAEGWKAACYKAQNETLAAAKERDSAKRGLESERFVNAAQVRKLTEERDSARLLLKDAEARADALGVAAEAWQERATSAEVNRNATIVAARQAEQRAEDAEARAAAAEARAEEVRAKAKDQELKEVYDLRENLVQTCLRAGQAESRLTAMRDERDTATAALKAATTEIERLKAAVAENARGWASSVGAVARAERERDVATARAEDAEKRLTEAQRQNDLLAMTGPWVGPRGAVVISVSGCGQCGFPTVSCLCPCWGVE